MAVIPFNREALDKVVNSQTTIRVRFQDRKSALLDLWTASLIRQACVARPDLERRILEQGQRSADSLGRLVQILTPYIKRAS